MERRLDPRSAQQCRDQAERLRGLAAKARSPAVQRDYRELAYEWDMMAEEIEVLRRERRVQARLTRSDGPT
jgi:hypothetical protein